MRHSDLFPLLPMRFGRRSPLRPARLLPLLLSALFGLGLLACTSRPHGVERTGLRAPLYPDYAGVTVPVNMAPLNFLLRADVSHVCVYVDDVELCNRRGHEARFDLGEWRQMLAKKVGKKVTVRVVVRQRGGWKEYEPFFWTIVADSVDSHLTYRLIEPDYEVFSHLVLQERCVEDFSIRNFADHGLVGNRCMNCHTYAGQDPNTSMFYLRGEGGGAILNQGGRLTKLDLHRPDMASGSVYFGFSPSGRYVVFSTNIIVPAFHALGSKRMEVFDTKSDVYVADLEEGRFVESGLLADSLQLETFPTFSPDGRYVYFCTAPRPASLKGIKSLRYSLCRIGFDEATGQFGTQVDTLYDARLEGRSVCHPRISPDGERIVYTVADYGTFPIWHREADLQMMNLKTLAIDDMEGVNSPMSDTYHSWSSNGRWLAFASKRDDGLYGKVYYTHLGPDGRWSKPLCLPQEHPTYYDNTLKSFNAPEQGRGRLPFTAADVQQVLSASAREFR